jgi:hypothetical protein
MSFERTVSVYITIEGQKEGYSSLSRLRPICIGILYLVVSGGETVVAEFMEPLRES